MKNLKITIIGAGALGRALAYKLNEKGFNLYSFVSRNEESAKEIASIVKCKFFSPDNIKKTNSDVYILAVPDKAIRATAEKLKKYGLLRDDTILIHLSGCLTSDVLKIDNNYKVLACHPIGSFKCFKSSIETLDKVYWTLEGDKEAIEFMTAFIKDLSGKFYKIKKEEKPLYHAVCTLVSNGLPGLVYIANEILRELFSKDSSLDMLLPLTESSMDNFKKLGFPEGVTGPLTRGDSDTINANRRVLKNYDSDLLSLYNQFVKIIQKHIKSKV